MSQRILITEDDVDALGMGGASRPKIETLLGWARDMETFEFEDGLTASYPLAVAAEYLADLGEFEEAKGVAREIATHPTCGPFDGHVQLIEISLREGAVDEARAVGDQLRRVDSVSYFDFERIASAFEMRELWPDAQRWCAIALRRLERDGLEDSDEYDRVLTTRFRIRRAAGLPWDVTDSEDLRSQDIFEIVPPD